MLTAATGKVMVPGAAALARGHATERIGCADFCLYTVSELEKSFSSSVLCRQEWSHDRPEQTRRGDFRLAQQYNQRTMLYNGTTTVCYHMLVLLCIYLVDQTVLDGHVSLQEVCVFRTFDDLVPQDDLFTSMSTMSADEQALR